EPAGEARIGGVVGEIVFRSQTRSTHEPRSLAGVGVRDAQAELDDRTRAHRVGGARSNLPAHDANVAITVSTCQPWYRSRNLDGRQAVAVAAENGELVAEVLVVAQISLVGVGGLLGQGLQIVAESGQIRGGQLCENAFGERGDLRRGHSTVHELLTGEG